MTTSLQVESLLKNLTQELVEKELDSQERLQVFLFLNRVATFLSQSPNEAKKHINEIKDKFEKEKVDDPENDRFKGENFKRHKEDVMVEILILLLRELDNPIAIIETASEDGNKPALTNIGQIKKQLGETSRKVMSSKSALTKIVNEVKELYTQTV